MKKWKINSSLKSKHKKNYILILKLHFILNFIIYWGEVLKRGKSGVLQKFNKNYEQSDFIEDEK